jgi:hypothetical protein
MQAYGKIFTIQIPFYRKILTDNSHSDSAGIRYPFVKLFFLYSARIPEVRNIAQYAVVPIAANNGGFLQLLVCYVLPVTILIT